METVTKEQVKVALNGILVADGVCVREILTTLFPPKFEPTVGQVVMVSEDGKRWFPCVFKGIRWIGNSIYYKCFITGTTGVWSWEFCRPLTTKEQGVQE